LLPETAQTP